MNRNRLIFLILLLVFSITTRAADIAATFDSSDGSSAFKFNDSGSNTMMSIDSDGNMQLKGGLRLDSSGSECPAAETLIVDGKIGIGTTDPGGHLHLIQNSNDWTRLVIDCAGTQDVQSSCLQLMSKGDGTTQLGNATVKGWWLGVRGEAYASPSLAGDMQAYFWDGTTWNITQHWDRLGNVGIGTIAPTATLEVNGNGLFKKALKSDQTIETASDLKVSGIIYSPAIPAFRAYKSGANITIAAGTHVFDGEELDNSGNYNTANGRFTAPVAGIYFFKIHFFLHTTYANTGNNYISISKNGSPVRTANFGANGYDGGFELSAVLKLNAGDYITSSSLSDIVTWGGGYNSFEGFLIAGSY